VLGAHSLAAVTSIAAITAIAAIASIAKAVAEAAVAMLAIVPVPFIGWPGGLVGRQWTCVWVMRMRREALLEALVEDVLLVVVAELLALQTLAHALPVAIGLIGVRLHLITVRHDDAAVVLGVLEIVLRQNRITRRLGVAREREILLGDMRRGSSHLHVWTVGFEAARQRILAFAIAAAAAAILLSLPHCLNGSRLKMWAGPGIGPRPLMWADP
jgi:hypothetical protein